MELPLARYQCISLDQIHTSSSFPSSNHKVLRTKPFFSGYCFRFGGRKLNNPFDKIKCVSPEQGLQPRRPKPKPSRTSDPELKGTEETRVKKPSVGICSQIEKLVLCNRYREALELFEILEIEGGFDVGLSTYDALVSACIRLGSVRAVKMVCGHMINNGFEPDQYMSNRVLLMHVKCGMMIDARKLFDEMPERNFVSWNTIIAGLVHIGDYLEAFRLFMIMWEEFSGCGIRTFALMITASAGLELISVGRQLHSCAVKMGVNDDVFVTCALINMYGKCGSIEDARWVFDDMPQKTTVGWNCIIAGYALHGYSEEALSMFYEMRDSGVKMDHFTFSMIFSICSRLASIEHAKQAHAGLVRSGFGLDIVANTALVDFYSKWGRIEDAQRVFDRMPCKNTISWNALIAGYGNHGRGAEAVDLFEQMLKERMRPDHVTFLAVLSACSYSRLFECGWEIFQSMSRDHKIKPRSMHYTCMIELLGQEGLLDEALALIRGAPFKPTVNMWAALLTASRVNENLELGKFAAEKLYGMKEHKKLCNYAVLLNIYKRSGKLKEAATLLQTMERKGLIMLPVCSWIEVNKKTHVFYTVDKRRIQTNEIYQKVDSLILEISKHGYVPKEKTFLPDVDEQEQHVLLYHSEKLAIAFGLLNTMNGSPLQIMQNHRICNNCHNAIKLIALVTRREIVVRDASRFHYFKDGSCSCGDYW
ncbi:hypothetical protein CCACVL1_11009 [Corchorus capsularis]|uniref:DYW domain-containing protein n=1 Tax=Corchorus capsularis TaxID=210143 RepID=A0A1R3INE6_COCAP|nr:hypothetical protein CCACVL1_11009 [Corchorus capsularis]